MVTARCFLHPNIVVLSWFSIMSLFKYFKSTKPGEILPKPGEPLASDLPSSVISAINKEIKGVLEELSSTAKETKHGKYDHYTPEKAEISKRAVKHGIAATIRFYSRNHTECPALKESTTCMWKNQYVLNLNENDRQVKRRLL